jgi:aryl-phospho-beta-D-glucosidase BglC (GH1 family)
MNYRITLILFFSALFLSCSGNDGTGGTTETPTGQPSTATFESASTAVKAMKAGWNLGNTLDCCSNEGDNWIEKSTDGSPKAYETAWGQPQATFALIKTFKDAGFNAIRVPVTWWPHQNASGAIDQQWMDRVETVVKYVLDNGMYCILNVHHDTGDKKTAWLKADRSQYEALNSRFVNLWKQIATRFAKYDSHLIFEGYNEMVDQDGHWSQPTEASSYTALNDFAQSFVNTVRQTGGNNAQRNLIVNTYAGSNSPAELSHFSLPNDPAKGHLIVGIHSYNPWNWDKNHGKWTTDCTSDIENMFARINTTFVSKGIPVIIGEYGALNIDASDADQDEGVKYTSCVVNTAKKYDIATFYWMGLIDKSDRTTLKWTQPKIKDAILKAY